MSEWHDSQNKQSSNFRHMLQQHLDKTNLRRELTIAETKRLTKLEVIGVKLKLGDNVQNHQLQTWLSEEEYAQLEAEWKE